MKLRFFTVSAMDAQADQDSLNAFLANHRVVTLDKELVQRGAESFWAVCVGYSLGAIATTDNLALAAWKAVRGKHLRPDVVRFFRRQMVRSRSSPTIYSMAACRVATIALLLFTIRSGVRG